MYNHNVRRALAKAMASEIADNYTQLGKGNRSTWWAFSPSVTRAISLLYFSTSATRSAQFQLRLVATVFPILRNRSIKWELTASQFVHIHPYLPFSHPNEREKKKPSSFQTKLMPPSMFWYNFCISISIQILTLAQGSVLALLCFRWGGHLRLQRITKSKSSKNWIWWWRDEAVKEITGEWRSNQGTERISNNTGKASATRGDILNIRICPVVK